MYSCYYIASHAITIDFLFVYWHTSLWVCSEGCVMKIHQQPMLGVIISKVPKLKYEHVYLTSFSKMH